MMKAYLLLSVMCCWLFCK